MHSLTMGKEGAKKLTLMTKYKVKFFKVLKTSLFEYGK